MKVHPMSLPGRFILVAVLLVQGSSAAAVERAGTIVGIADGDTLTLLDGGKAAHRIRLDGIDAPERTQPFGQRARQSLAELAHGRDARADCPKTDRYGRSVCRVIVDGVDIGLEQVRRGFAWHYIRYAHEQRPSARLAYSQAEERARAQHVGLWAVPTPVAPWDYRRGRAAESH